MSGDLHRLLLDLEQAGPAAERASYKALQVEAHAMRDDWREALSGAQWRNAARAVSYDMLPTGLRRLTAEVGFDDRGQGELGNLLEFGSSTQGPLRPAGARVLKDGADRLEKYLSRIDPL